MATVVNLDGKLVPPAKATISVFDRGFLYGDSVYEVVRTYRRRPFELDAHLARLARSAGRLGLEPAWDAPRTRRELLATLAAVPPEADPDPEAAPWNQGQLSLRVIMTRGAGELGLDPALAVEPRALVIASPLRAPPLAAYRAGVGCRIVGVRHEAPGAVDPGAKTGAHLANVLAVREARASGAHEALLLGAGGQVTEGASSNVFAVRAGALVTPPLGAGILAGVTRALVLELAREAGLPAREAPLLPADLAGAEELFLTSTAREILPVTSLDGRPAGGGRVGPVTTRLGALFRARADRAAGGPG
ncbi:aminotransferase class IV [Anaeromyxobacter diazotrophicus]|uniref:branched-chain-amino-acid transaminase n=1 Tax=Anaeromyxobacter diazotrophicus TaxID=2590199 RepID=A0A7I9VJU2_9BACT|nr:aminotransferase class IV [Anaeromyxobacter diazotrophicus]GEJ56267.1 branched chain amino acid aminotransferase [Anaeromyxobacter diazotrophicus]